MLPPLCGCLQGQCYLEMVASRSLYTVLHQWRSSWCYSVVRRRDWYVQNSSKLEHSTQPQNCRGPMLMYKEFLHLLPMLYQLACAPNCYEFGFLRPLSEDGVCRWACSQAWHQVGLLSCFSHLPFRIMSSSWLIRALCKWKVLDTVLATLGCSRQRLNNLLILAMPVLMVVLRSSNLRAWWARQMSSAWMNFLHIVAGRSLMYKLKRVGASTWTEKQVHSSRRTWRHTALNIKLLEPLAQGASRFERLLAPQKSTGPQFFQTT